jgi:hypothetical protein
MRSVGVVVCSPGFEHCAGVRKRAEQGFVEQFIAQASNERFDKGILDWLARRDVVPGDLVIVGPLQDGIRG